MSYKFKSKPGEDILTSNPDGKPKKKPLPPPGTSIDMDPEEATRLKTELLSMYRESKADSNAIENRIKGYWDEYYQGTEHSTRNNGIMEDAADVHVPILQWIVSGLHAQITQQTFETDPLALVLPGADGDTPRASRIEDYFKKHMEEDIGYPELADEIGLNALMEGGAVAYVPWRERRKMMYRRKDKEDEDFYDEFEDEDDTDVTLGNEVVFDGPDPQIILRNQIHLYPSNAYRIDKADAVFLDVEIDRNDLMRSKRDEEYPLMDGEKWDSVLNKGKMAARSYPSNNKSVEQEYYTRNKFKAIECFYWWDIDGDGEMEPVCATILEDGEVLLDVTLSEYGEDRPIIVYHLLTPGKSLFAPSMGQILEWAFHVLNTLFNQKLDDTKIRHAAPKTILYTGLSGFDPDKLKYGKPLEVDDIREILPLTFPDMAPDIISFMEYVIGMVVRLTGMSDMFMGKAASGTQTATETSSLVNLGSVRFKQMMNRISQGHAKFMKWVSTLHYYFMEKDEIEYYMTIDEAREYEIKKRVMDAAVNVAPMMGISPEQAKAEVMAMFPPKGIIETRTVKRDDFSPFPTVRFVPQGSKVNINRDVVLRDAIMAWNMFNQDPMFLMSAPHRWELARNVFASMGYVVERMLPSKPQDGPAIPENKPEPTVPKVNFSMQTAPVILDETAIRSILASAGIQGSGTPDIDGEEGLDTTEEDMQNVAMAIANGVGGGSPPVDPTNPGTGLPPLPPIGGMENSPEELANQLAAQSRQEGFSGG